jgi:hypothetical protein
VVQMFDDDVRFRESGTVVDRVEEIADRTDFDKSEVYRRLLRLGLDDIDQLGDDALDIPESTEPTAEA